MGDFTQGENDPMILDFFLFVLQQIIFLSILIVETYQFSCIFIFVVEVHLLNLDKTASELSLKIFSLKKRLDVFGGNLNSFRKLNRYVR